MKIIIVISFFGALTVSTKCDQSSELYPDMDEVYKLLEQEKTFIQVQQEYISFVVNTRTNSSKSSPLTTNHIFENMDKNSPVKVIIHGFKEHGEVTWYDDIVKAYLQKGDYHVITIDWSKWSKKKFYWMAAAATYQVGSYIGDFLASSHLNLDNVHIVGHSLGAQVAGFAGSRVYESINRKVFRITGLDLARPLFEIPIYGPENYLDKSDAQFVDVVHTDARFFGFKYPTGHSDFYPNGGFGIQPGCEIKNVVRLKSHICGHKRSHAFFIESINTKNVVGVKFCDSWLNFKAGYCDQNTDVTFGEEASPNVDGVFYFITNAEYPYLT